jgi:hypothetical protein
VVLELVLVDGSDLVAIRVVGAIHHHQALDIVGGIVRQGRRVGAANCLLGELVSGIVGVESVAWD